MGNKRIYTVGELINKLSTFDENTIVVIMRTKTGSGTSEIEVSDEMIAPITDPDEDLTACVIRVEDL